MVHWLIYCFKSCAIFTLSSSCSSSTMFLFWSHKTSINDLRQGSRIFTSFHEMPWEQLVVYILFLCEFFYHHTTQQLSQWIKRESFSLIVGIDSSYRIQSLQNKLDKILNSIINQQSFQTRIEIFVIYMFYERIKNYSSNLNM